MLTPSTWRVRAAREDDVPALHELILELAAHSREPDAVTAEPDDLRRALFADQPLVHALVADVDQPAGTVVAGMALWFVSYSTWHGRPGIWLEDLFVRPTARRLGLGRALLVALAAESVRRGYARLEWSVLDWNTEGISFYAALGAEPLTGCTVNRISGPTLAALAADASGHERAEAG